MNIFLDTNVLLDLLRPNLATSLVAAELLDEISSEGNRGIVAATSIKDACWILEDGVAFKRVYPSRASRHALAQKLRKFALNTLTIAPVDEITIRRADLNTKEEDFEDAVIAACAELSGADCIVSNDRKAFQHCNLKKFTPMGCLEVLQA